METVIVTGCLYSAWRNSIPILEAAGLKLVEAAPSKDQCEMQSSEKRSEHSSEKKARMMDAKLDVNGKIEKQNSMPARLLLIDSQSLSLLDYMAAKNQSAKFLLFYSNADTALESACQAEIDPNVRLEGWKNSVRQLLQFYRRYRRRTVLINNESFLQHPQALMEVCHGLGIYLQQKQVSVEAELQKSTIEGFLSKAIVDDHPAIQWLQSELTAKSQSFAIGSVTRYNPVELFYSQQQRIRFERKLNDKMEKVTSKLLRNERQVIDLKNEIKKQQEKIEDLIIERDQKSKAVAEKQVRLTNVENEKSKLVSAHQTKLAQEQQNRKKLETENNEIAQENELLLLQLHQVQEELENYFLRNQNFKQARARIEKEQKEAVQAGESLSHELQQVRGELTVKDRQIDIQHQRIAWIKQTFSWKITAPLRALAKPLNYLNKDTQKTKEQIKLLKTSNHFDEAYYLTENEDVARMGDDPVEHYIIHGAAEGRDPSPAFNTRRYLEINPDVAETGMNPLVHFVKYGILERRAI